MTWDYRRDRRSAAVADLRQEMMRQVGDKA